MAAEYPVAIREMYERALREHVVQGYEGDAWECLLAEADGNLTFEVTDDGAGFDPAETDYGTGLQGMADRLDAIGGTLKVRSALGEGTTVAGQLAVAEEVAR